MGRRKIAIQAIAESKIRHNTFNKRKNGLVKKAAELSMLCNIKMLLMFEDLHGNLVQYSTHGNYEPKKYFVSCKTPKFYEFTSGHYPNFFKGAMSEKKDAKIKFSEKDSDHLAESPLRLIRAGNEQFEALEANTKTALKLVEKLNVPRFNMNELKDEQILSTADKELLAEGRFTEDVRKRQKVDETQQKLEYLSDSENNEEKMESEENDSMEENPSEANSRNQVQATNKSKTAIEPGAALTEINNVAATGLYSNQLQALTLNYAINALQNPMNPLRMHNNTDLLTLTKSMLMLSQLRNSGENSGNLDELLWGANLNNAAYINQMNRNTAEPVIARYMSTQHK